MTENVDDIVSELEELYQLDSPGTCPCEDRTGHFYPYPISVPGIAHIQYPEPHVLITDLYDDQQDWYHIRGLIGEFARQSFVCYNKGLYFASTAASISCVELTLKYECIRNGKDPHTLEGNWTLGTAIIDCQKKGLFVEFDTKLNLINKARNGIFHFNPKKLREAITTIKNNIDEINSANNPDVEIKRMGLVYDGEIGRLVDESELPPDDPLTELTNFEWSVIAYYSYELMNEIGRSIYGIEKKHEKYQESLADYSRRDQISKDDE